MRCSGYPLQNAKMSKRKARICQWERQKGIQLSVLFYTAHKLLEIVLFLFTALMIIVQRGYNFHSDVNWGV